MFGFVFGLLARLPLRINHAFGRLLGRLAWTFSGRHRRTMTANLNQHRQWRGAHTDWLDAAIAAQGEGVSELAYVWSRPLTEIYALIESVEGWEHATDALAAQRPIIFVSPHLGCYEMAGRFIAQRAAITALYRPPKVAWLEPFMQGGRSRGGATTVPANATGVRQVLKTLKAGGNIFILPDQVPAAEQGGEGVWADFLGRPAYTMTLLPKLARSYHAVVIFVVAERLSNGRGFAIRCTPMESPFDPDNRVAARQLNAMVERLIDTVPAQYLWSYNRFKQPAGAPPPPYPMRNSSTDAPRG